MGGEGISSFGLESRDADGDVDIGGEAGGDDAGLDLGVKERKADGPFGECIEDAKDVFKEEEDGKDGETREYGE